MQLDQAGSSNGALSLANRRPPFVADRAGLLAELDGLRATCERQARAIATLGEALSTFRRGATALKAENAELRAENHRMRSRPGTRWRAAGGVDDDEAIEVRIPLDGQAPGAARIIVAQCLRDRVVASVLDDAKLLGSELVTNSVRHSGASAADGAVLRMRLMRGMMRLEVEDPGAGGVVAPHPADCETGEGFGLTLVQALSERWGVERVAEGGTRVWAQLPRAAGAALPGTSSAFPA